MSDILSSIRAQSYRMAWIYTCAIFAVVILVLVLPDNANRYGAGIGFFFLFGVGILSIPGRRFAPLAWALVGFGLLVVAICA